jgi:hypothetical protein
LVVIREFFSYLVDTCRGDNDMFVLSRKYHISEV